MGTALVRDFNPLKMTGSGEGHGGVQRLKSPKRESKEQEVNVRMRLCGDNGFNVEKRPGILSLRVRLIVILALILA